MYMGTSIANHSLTLIASASGHTAPGLSGVTEYFKDIWKEAEANPKKSGCRRVAVRILIRAVFHVFQISHSPLAHLIDRLKSHWALEQRKNFC